MISMASAQCPYGGVIDAGYAGGVVDGGYAGYAGVVGGAACAPVPQPVRVQEVVQNRPVPVTQYRSVPVPNPVPNPIPTPFVTPVPVPQIVDVPVPVPVPNPVIRTVERVVTVPVP